MLGLPHSLQLHDQPRLPPGSGGQDLQIEDLERLVSNPLSEVRRGEVIVDNQISARR